LGHTQTTTGKPTPYEGRIVGKVTLDFVATKHCRRCGHTKATTEFNRHRNRPDGLQTQCRGCIKSQQRDWFQKNKLSHTRSVLSRRKTLVGRCRFALSQSRQRARRGGFAPCVASIEQLAIALIRQRFLCAVCGASDSQYAKKLHMDHCHTTGIFRDWLCVRCNTQRG
jgi:hypothetical protein